MSASELRHEMRIRWMNRAPYWRCKVCLYETADLTRVANHVVANQYEEKRS